MLQIKHVTKKIKGNIILDDISLTLEKGKIYGLTGTNGCGKTMLLRLICSLILPTSGEIIRDPGLTYGVIIETPGFLFHESAEENLNYLASINKKIGKAEVGEALKAVGLYEKRKTKVKKFSLGMVQKLGIAQAIMEKPQLLLLDEPFNALDKGSVQQVIKLLLELQRQGTSMVIAAHNIDFIEEHCDEILQMENGKLLA